MASSKKEITIYLISDSIGETAQKILGAVTAQFPNVVVKEIKRFPFITSTENLQDILRDAVHDHAILITTLVNHDLVSLVHEFCARTGLSYVDYMTPLTEIIRGKTGEQPLQEPGTLHKLDDDYFSRVSAIEYAVRYDDGKDPRAFKDADIVLLGISRTSKTPLSMYLANKMYKVANLPLIPEVPIPQELSEIPTEKIIGLTSTAESLMNIRKSRLKALGLKDGSSYTDVQRIKDELNYAEKIFNQFNITPIDVHNKAIEETAILVEMKINKFVKNL